MPLNAWSTRDRQRVSGEGVSAMSGVTPGTAGTAGRIAIIGTAAIGIRGAMVIGGMSMTSGTSGASGISGISGISISMSMSESAPRGVIAGPIKSKSIAIGASIGMSTMSDISGISGMSGMSGMSGISMSMRSEEHTSELQSRRDLVCRLLLEKKKKRIKQLKNEQKRKL